MSLTPRVVCLHEEGQTFSFFDLFIAEMTGEFCGVKRDETRDYCGDDAVIL